MNTESTYFFSSVIWICLILFHGFLANLYAQTPPAVEEQTFIINNTKPGVRSTALASATVGDYTELSSVYLNPAGLSFVRNIKRVEFHSSQNWDNNLMLQNLTVPFLAVNRHRIALQTGYLHRGLESVNPPFSDLESSPNLTLSRFDLAYAYSITPTISLGGLYSASFANNSESNLMTNIASFGVMYVPSKSISYGFAFRGLGENIGYRIANENQTELFNHNATESIELAGTLNYPIDTDRTYFSLSIANEKKFGVSGLWYKMGLELNLNASDNLFHVQLRNGIIMHPDTEIYAPTTGLGLNIGKFSLSYSISPGTQLDERFQQLGFIIHFDKQ